MPGGLQKVLDTMKITRPKPRSRIPGTNACVSSSADSTLTADVELELVEWLEFDHRRRVDKDVAPAVALEHKLRGLAYVIRVAEVEDDVARRPDRTERPPLRGLPGTA